MLKQELKYLSPPEFPNIFDNMMARMLFIGSSGSGKTYTLVQVLKTMKGYVDNVFVINPTEDKSLRTLLNDFILYQEYDEATDEVLESIITTIKENLITFKTLQKYKEVFKKYLNLINGVNFDEIDFENFIRTNLRSKEVSLLEKYDYESPDIAFADFPYKVRPPLNMIIIDDSLGTRLFRASKTTALSNFFIKSRHYHTNFCILTQYFKGIPKLLRANNNYFFIWRTFDSTILRSLYDEISSFIEYDKFIELFKIATTDRYGFLFVDTKNRQISSGLNKVIFKF